MLHGYLGTQQHTMCLLAILQAFGRDDEEDDAEDEEDADDEEKEVESRVTTTTKKKKKEMKMHLATAKQ